MLEARSITFRYHEPLIESLHFTLSPGQYLWISGGNGAGKSTLLKIIVGLIEPEAGVIYWQGKPFTKKNCETLIYVGHQNGLSGSLTLSENIQLDWYRHDDTYRTGLEALQLQSALELPVAHLSHGQQRKAALLRLWMQESPLWVLDEPFEGLDQSAVSVLEVHMQQHLLKGGLIVLVSHQAISFLPDRQVRHVL